MQFRDHHDKTRYVNRMFGRIASRYDWGNRVLSLGRDQSWRRRAVDMLDPTPDHWVLDVGAGTGDLSLYLARRAGAVVALDFSHRMMGIGVGKAATSGVQDRVCFVAADALRLPFANDSFDGTAVAFTIRNFVSLDDGLAEIHRVLRPGGRRVCLEFTRPKGGSGRTSRTSNISSRSSVEGSAAIAMRTDTWRRRSMPSRWRKTWQRQCAMRDSRRWSGVT